MISLFLKMRTSKTLTPSTANQVQMTGNCLVSATGTLCPIAWATAKEDGWHLQLFRRSTHFPVWDKTSLCLDGDAATLAQPSQLHVPGPNIFPVLTLLVPTAPSGHTLYFSTDSPSRSFPSSCIFLPFPYLEILLFITSTSKKATLMFPVRIHYPSLLLI